MLCPTGESMSRLHVPGACAHLGDPEANFAESSRTRATRSYSGQHHKNPEGCGHMVGLVASRMVGVFIGLLELLRPGEGSCVPPALWAVWKS